jgi:esterase
VSFTPAHSLVAARDAAPTRTAYVLHGILGSGRNWRTTARRLAAARPDTRYVLVDLRNHGRSDGAPPPHSVTTAADDLVALHAEVGPPDEAIGHSFGGKVALRYAERHPQGLGQVWVLDSRADGAEPDPDNDVARVLRALRRVPVPLAEREEVVEHLSALGFGEMLSRWMTTNLVRGEGGFVFAFDLDAVDEMIQDYWRQDLWPVLRDPPCPIDVVRAGRSDRWSPQVVARYADEAHEDVTLHVLPDAGHWLHVDDPEGLVRLMTGGGRA